MKEKAEKQSKTMSQDRDYQQQETISTKARKRRS
jgi:hypothetical protein